MIINNWRASHSFPLNTLQIYLRDNARKVDEAPLIAQRIKRLSSTKSKLCREPSMQLSQMQDIGGCRAVLANVEAEHELRELYQNSRMRHTLVKENDYISQPKFSGYRSIHRIYRYVSDRSDTYNGLQIEVQIRSQLQHAWATAVETVGTFLEQALKASRGSDEWLRFFVLMGSAMAIREKKPLVPNSPTSEIQLIRELKKYARDLTVERTLRAYHATLRLSRMPEVRGARYFLVELRPSGEKVNVSVTAYRGKELQEATDKYLAIETTLTEPGSEAVLVSVESLDSLRRAYPNYFLDTDIFLDVMKEFIT